MKFADDFPNELRGYLAHLRGKYRRGKYATDEAIHEAICQGKVFVFRLTPAVNLLAWAVLLWGVIYAVYRRATLWFAGYPGEALAVPSSGEVMMLVLAASAAAAIYIAANRPFFVVGPKGAIWRTMQEVRGVPWAGVTKVWGTETITSQASHEALEIDRCMAPPITIRLWWTSAEFPFWRGKEFLMRTAILCWCYALGKPPKTVKTGAHFTCF